MGGGKNFILNHLCFSRLKVLPLQTETYIGQLPPEITGT